MAPTNTSTKPSSTSPKLQDYDFPASHRTSPLFKSGKGAEADEVLVIFVLGGPGAGKGTQCTNLVRDYGFAHLSAGDLLRKEQERPGSEFGEMIATVIKEGQIVPMEVTIQLLENAMQDVMKKDKTMRFVIDGFPRKLDQAVEFERVVVKSMFTLFLQVPEMEMEKRLLKRGETSGRSDDNKESIGKRFKTFEDTSMPVVDMFEGEGRVVRVGGTGSVKDVYDEIKLKMKEKGIERVQK